MSTDGYFSMFPILVVNKLGWTFICVFNRDTTLLQFKSTLLFLSIVGIQVQKSGTHHRQQQQQYILNIFVQ